MVVLFKQKRHGNISCLDTKSCIFPWLNTNILYCHIRSSKTDSHFCGFLEALVPSLTAKSVMQEFIFPCHEPFPVQQPSCHWFLFPLRLCLDTLHRVSSSLHPVVLGQAENTTLTMPLLPLSKYDMGFSLAKAVSNSISLGVLQFKIMWRWGRVLCKTSSERFPFYESSAYKNI